MILFISFLKSCHLRDCPNGFLWPVLWSKHTVFKKLIFHRIPCSLKKACFWICIGKPLQPFRNRKAIPAVEWNSLWVKLIPNSQVVWPKFVEVPQWFRVSARNLVRTDPWIILIQRSQLLTSTSLGAEQAHWLTPNMHGVRFGGCGYGPEGSTQTHTHTHTHTEREMFLLLLFLLLCPAGWIQLCLFVDLAGLTGLTGPWSKVATQHRGPMSDGINSDNGKCMDCDGTITIMASKTKPRTKLVERQKVRSQETLARWQISIVCASLVQ